MGDSENSFYLELNSKLHVMFMPLDKNKGCAPIIIEVNQVVGHQGTQQGSGHCVLSSRSGFKEIAQHASLEDRQDSILARNG